MDFNKRIDEISKKYKYDNELTEALKRCIPAMVKGKSNSEIELLLETLERVEILDLKEQPTAQQLNEIEREKINEKNEHVKFVTGNKGEYGKKDAPGAYQSIAIFDENMDIVDRVGYIYLTRLSEYTKETKKYQTTINLSHLVHELGHAWSAQKDEYVQEENGDFTCNVGATTINYRVDRENCTVTETNVKGLFMEEALNSLEEEKALCEILGINNVDEIPGYVPSQYQGLMKSVMERFVEKIGELPFSKLRILKDKKDLEQYQSILEESENTKYLKSKEWNERKRKTFDKVEELEQVPEERKESIQNFFKKYENVYFSTEHEKTFFEKLDNVLEQLYDFNSIKYEFNIISSEKNREIFSDIQLEILREAYAPLNQVQNQIEEYNQQKSNISMKNLVKQALQTRSKRE